MWPNARTAVCRMLPTIWNRIDYLIIYFYEGDTRVETAVLTLVLKH